MRVHSFARGADLRSMLLAASATSLLACIPAQAQNKPGEGAGENTPSPNEVIVRGIRASQESALAIKRDADQIVDAISAEDVGKLPDQNIAESLQRITGVQINRSLGEGSGVSVRGLTQNRFEIDGATLVGNDTGRGVNFESIPSELYSSIRVYKSPTADQVEGSLGALVRLTTLRPLDMKRNQKTLIAGSAQAAYSDYRKAWDPTLSITAAGRTSTGVGEVGAVLSLSYQRRSLRNDFIQINAWDRVALTDRNGNGRIESATSGPLTGDEVYQPRQIRLVAQYVDRERIGGLATVQWRPASNLDLRATANYLEYSFENDYRQIQFATNRPASATTGAVISPDATLLRAQITGVSFGAQNFSIPTKQTNFNGQLEADWKATERLSIHALASMGRGRNTPLLRIYPVLQQAVAQTMVYDFGSPNELPTIALPNIDFNSLSSYAGNTVATQRRDPRNDDTAYMVDVDYKIDAGWLRSFEAGARYSTGGVAFDFYRATSSTLLRVPTATLVSQLGADAFQATLPSGNDFLGNLLGTVPRGWTTFNPDFLTGAGGKTLLQLAGLSGDAVPFDYAASWTVAEKTYAGYAKLNLRGDIAALPFTGNIGVRYVKTDTMSRGYFPTTTAPGYIAQDFNNSYGDWLPSGNLTFYPARDLLVRLAASKVMSRPGYPQLSAATTYQPAQLLASAGNPFLDPFRATQADLSVEWYFRRGDLLSVAFFYKDVAAFIVNETLSVRGPDLLGGTIDYLLTRPANGRNGKIKGLEVNFEHAFAELPAPLDGLGVRANYTFVDSTTPSFDEISNQNLPIQGLSRHSYNLTGYYEKYGAQLRLTYNWRDDFVSSTFAGRPVFTQGTGRLDGSLGYDVTKQISVTAEAINLTNARDFDYFVVKERPLQLGVNDRRFLFGIRARF
ncbi:MAG TPA: TonB-dependent receptor [Sphingomonas sp.]|nr:TonB-dependent receptor [Sphingomonas sp.]